MFYIIEKQEQLDKLELFGDCFISFIRESDNYHPKLSPLSLIYLRSLNQHKGYIFCIKHNESFSLLLDDVINWLLNNTDKLWVIDKKEALYNFPYGDKLYDINFIEKPKLNIDIPAISYYNKTLYNYPSINRIIPISKHYEKNELIFGLISPIILKYRAEDAIYAFNNGPLTDVFYNIEQTGIKIDKKCFIDYYNELQYPEFNINKGRIYSHYNLYTTTGRPSNTFNNINFAALNKTDGERLCYIPGNDKFIEMDIQGYHPRLIGELIDFKFDERNTYETLGELLGVTTQEAKELTFKQIYGGVWKEYRNKPFFKQVYEYTNNMFGIYQDIACITKSRIFIPGETKSAPTLLNWIVQSIETSRNVEMLVNILNYLSDKKTKLILYTYDAFLFDYNKDDGDELLMDIKNIIKYPLNIKQGKSYHGLKNFKYLLWNN